LTGKYILMFRRIILPSSTGSRSLDLGLLDLEDKSTTTLKNVGNYSPNNTASLPGRPESLTFPVSGQGDGGWVKRRRKGERRTARRRRKGGGEEEDRGRWGGGRRRKGITTPVNHIYMNKTGTFF